MVWFVITLFCMIGIVFLFAFQGNLFVSALLGVLALVVMVLFWVQLHNKTMSITDELLAADKHNLFTSYTRRLNMCWESVLLKESFFIQFAEDHSIKKAYDMIRLRIEQNIKSATTFISHYDYISKPRSDYLDNILKESMELINKLSALSDQVLEVNDSAFDIDTSFADDMLDALRKVVEERNERL